MQITIDSIIKCLSSHLDSDAKLQVVDESHMHYGHTGHNPLGGVTHVEVYIVWQLFAGVSALERQRMLNKWLSDFFKEGLHSISYILKTPNEVINS